MTAQASTHTTIFPNVKKWLINHKDWFRLGIKIVILLIIVWLLACVCFGFHRISGPSMSKRLEDGDLVLFNRLVNEYKEGDVVIYTHEGKSYVSVILAKANDIIEIDDYGYLSLNGAKISDEIIFTPEQRDLIGPASVFRIPSDSYYVLNENLDSLEDSRSFGAILNKDIKGKIIGLLRTRSI